ncbi:unnamed protein product [Effrenium voratum]|uniref:DEAD/DEAH box helicase n=1 Tax=Effrenium voratum TaxID=2562239 RepID=A0AA36IHR7_9DINO|nr:unnamed protein product [Effrenium voratum]
MPTGRPRGWPAAAASACACGASMWRPWKAACTSSTCAAFRSGPKWRTPARSAGAGSGGSGSTTCSPASAGSARSRSGTSRARSRRTSPATCAVGADGAPAGPPGSKELSMGDAPMGDAPMKAESGSSGLGECSPSVRIKQEARQANPPKGPTELKEPREIFGGLQARPRVALDLDESPEPRRGAGGRAFHLLQLSPELEACAELLRRFASSYFLCERSMPLVARSAARIWGLARGHGALPRLLDAELGCRQLLQVARDSFELFWQQVDVEEDPCGLRSLRPPSAPLLCVRYKGGANGRGRRVRPADIVRCELQGRRRMLELAQASPRGVSLDPCGLPPPEDPAPAPTVAPPNPRAAAAVGRPVDKSLDGMALINALKAEPWYVGQAVHVSQVGARTARFAQIRRELHPALKSVLSEKLKLRRPGAESTWELYSHQAEALDALSDSKDVVVSTSTGSGKSLVYQIPIFEALLKEPEATAILVFPTKALAQDQLRALKDLAQALAATGALPSDAESWVACLDGDTLGAERTRVRREAKVVLSNPDMLHSHVLPQHVEYARLLQNLHYVVLDEVHVYRGAFGAHVCNIIRRLRRVVEAPLQFIACSATVANPGEHLERLLGPRPQAPSVVARDGSPSGGHVYVLWNPAALVEGSQTAKRRRKDGDCSVEAEASVAEAQPREPESTHEELINGARASPIVEVTRLIAWLVSREVSVLAFCKWRSLVEIVLQDVREALADEADLSRRVVSYRAGYPAHLRRQLEKDIFARKVLGVACTNALELGIDIGRLDCTLSLGFPGSVSSLKQQFGRAGRAGHPGISFFVGFEDPIDQHFMRAPRELLARRAESVAVAPLNLAVLALQLPCLAAERAIDASPEGDARFWRGEEEEADAFQLAAQKCLADGSLERGESDGREALVPARRWAVRPGGPHRAVSIRAVEDHFEVVEEVKSAVGNGDGGFLQRREASHGAAMAFRKLDEIELSKAFYSLHPGAVYRYRGAEYHVADLDLRRRRATVQKCEAPLAYYTRAFDITTVRIHTRERQAVSGQATVCLGQIRLESRVKSFRRFWKAAHQEGNEDIELNLPSWGYSSRGLWFEDPLGIARQPTQPETAQDGPEGAWTWGCGWAGAHAAMHALLHVFPLFVLADRQDLDAACIDEHGVPPMDHPRLMLFDAKEGGLGLCDAAFPHGFALLREARRLVEDCACESGCPQCIVDSRCREYNRFLSKRGALEWLSGLESGCAAGPGLQ